MKRIISMAAVSVFCGMTAAQKVEVADVEALPGETVTLTMQIDTEGGDYTGLEFDIIFPAAGFTTTGKATNTKENWDGAFTIGDVGGVGINNLARCALMSYTDTSIPGDGLQPLGTVEFVVGNDVPLGVYTVTLTNMTLIGDGRFAVADATFTLRVVAAHAVVLDENSTTAPSEAAGVNVTVIRTINADEWSTICLPFAMTAEQVGAAFGSDTQIADFTGYDTTEDDEENIVGITVNFNYVTEMEANHPYLIKVREKVTQFAVNGVTIEPEDYPQVSFGFTTGKGSKAVYHPVDFNGTYVADFDFYNDAERRALFLNGNKFYYATENTRHIKAFRAYFDFDDVLASVDEAGARIAMRVDDGGASGIYQVTTDEALAPYLYDLKGRRVGVGRSTIKKGLYIRNGRKEVVR